MPNQVYEDINLNFIPGGIMPICHASQYDAGIRIIRVHMYAGNTVYTFNTGSEGKYCLILKVRKPDGNIVTRKLPPYSIPGANTEIAEITVTDQMVAVAGKNICELSVQDAETDPANVVASANFIMEVEKDPTYGGLTSESDIHNLEQQIRDITASEMGNYYTKSEADGKFADVSNVYTKSEADEIFADASNVYTKSEADELLDEKVNESDVYKKYTVDNLLYGKADKSDIQTVLHTYTLDESNPEITGFGSIEDMYTVWPDNFGSEINLRDSASMQGSIAGSIADNEMFFPVETVTGDTVEGNSNWAKINDSEYDYVYASCRYLLATKGVRFTNQNVSGIPIRILNANIKLNQRGIGVSHPTNIRKISGRQSIVITNGTERTDVTVPGSREYTIPLGQTIYDGRLLIAQARNGSIAIHVTSNTNGVSMKDLDWQYDEDLQYFYAIIDGMKIADSGTLKLEGSLYSYYTSGSGNIDDLPTYCMTNYHIPAGECVVINDPSHRNLDTFLYAIDHLDENEDIIVYPAEEGTSILIRNYTDHILTVSSDNIVMIPGCDITSITVDIVTDVKEDIQALNNDVDEVNERIDDLILNQYTVNEFSSTPLATLTDSANNVPMKSLSVNIVPKETGTGTKSPSNPYMISGSTEIKVVQAGKNIFNPVTVLNAYLNSTGVIKSSVSTRLVYARINPNTTYTVSKQAGQRFQVAYCDSLPEAELQCSGMISNGTASSITITTGATAQYIVAFVYHSSYDIVTPEQMLATIQIEQGSTATTYEPYSATTHTIALGQTIYGGEVDVVSGSGTETQVKITFDGSSDEYWSTYLSRNGFYINIPDMETSNGEIDYSCNYLKVTSNWEENCGIRYGANNKFIYCLHIIDNLQDVTDVATWRTYLSNNPLVLTYPLATPIPITTTPTAIKTTGYDNVIADCGDVEGEYYVDPSYKEITGTLAAGETSITLYSSLINSDSTLDFYTDTYGVNPTDATATDGSVTLIFEAQSSDVSVKIKVS